MQHSPSLPRHHARADRSGTPTGEHFSFPVAQTVVGFAGSRELRRSTRFLCRQKPHARNTASQGVHASIAGVRVTGNNVCDHPRAQKVPEFGNLWRHGTIRSKSRYGHAAPCFKATQQIAAPGIVNARAPFTRELTVIGRVARSAITMFPLSGNPALPVLTCPPTQRVSVALSVVTTTGPSYSRRVNARFVSVATRSWPTVLAGARMPRSLSR